MTSLYSSDGHGSLATLDRIVDVDKFIQLEALLPGEVALWRDDGQDHYTFHV